MSPPQPPTFLWATIYRIPGTASVWALFGVAAGVQIAPAASGPIMIAAMIVAGLIVYVPLGVLLAVIGAKWKETLCGGAIGMVVALIMALVSARPDADQLAAFGLTFGGLVGGTFLNFAYRLPRLVFSQLRKLMTSPAPAERAVAA
jgi:hypothetical protein